MRMFKGKSAKTAAMSMLVVFAMFIGAGFDRVLLEVGTASDQFSSSDNYNVIGETYDAIRENYVLQEDFTDEELVWGAAAGMIETLGDTDHSTFLNPQQAIEWEQSSNNELIGIGISVNTQGEFPVVTYPMKDTPAMKAGILPGDVIIGIDGQDLKGMNPSEAIDLIRGEAGTDVTLTILREGAGDQIDITITREQITLDPVSYAMLPNNVLWLRLDQFSRGSSTRVAEGLAWGEEQGMTSVIFDLRGNPGGYVIEALGVASQFLPDGTPFLQEQAMSGEPRTTYTIGNKGLYLDGPLVVLIDNNSASAAEITSAAIKESGRGELIGLTTAGTGTVLLPFDLSDGSVAVLGISLFLTGYGTDIYRVGVEPSQVVKFSTDPYAYPYTPSILMIDDGAMDQEAFDELVDPQLHEAFDLLQN